MIKLDEDFKEHMKTELWILRMSIEEALETPLIRTLLYMTVLYMFLHMVKVL